MWQTKVLNLAVVAVACLAAEMTLAGDWPQILGPDRNGKAADERLLDTWPSAGPQRIWKYPLGSGYAGAAVDRSLRSLRKIRPLTKCPPPRSAPASTSHA